MNGKYFLLVWVVFAIALTNCYSLADSGKKNILIIPENPFISEILTNNGFNVIESGLQSEYNSFEVVFLLQAEGNDALIKWTRLGGVLVTDHSSSDWALNSAKLLHKIRDKGTLDFLPEPNHGLEFHDRLMHGVDEVYANLTLDIQLPLKDSVSAELRFGGFRTFTGFDDYQVLASVKNSSHPAILSE